MSEPKPLASLSSSLLARKGQAKPAMRPQGYAGFGMNIGAPQSLEDLGWNDHGHDHDHFQAHVHEQPVEDRGPASIESISADIVHLMPETPAVVVQQEELVRALTPIVAHVEAVELPRPSFPRAAAGSKGKAAFTLRLDPERHLKLRLVCAVNHKSAQATVIAALDAYLDTQPAVADFARSVPDTQR